MAAKMEATVKLFESIEAYIGRAFSPLLAELAVLRAKVAGMDAAAPPTLDPEILRATVADVLAGLPKPKDGNPGVDAEIDYARVGELVKTQVDLAIAALPAPVALKGDPGKDAVVDWTRVDETIELRVTKAIANLPKPKDGKPGNDAAPVNYDHINSIIKAAAIVAVSELPKPEPGKDAVVDVAMLDAAVERALPGHVHRLQIEMKDALDHCVAEIPRIKGDPGDAGKSYEPEVLQAAVSDAVNKGLALAIHALPKPTGEPVSLDVIDRMVATAIAAIPKPKDGESVPRESVERMVADAVSVAIAAIPKPKDGESVHPDTVARLVVESVNQAVEKEVSKAISAIKLPKDGEPGRDAIDIDIVDELDPLESYEMGTFARHRGGLVKAAHHTHPISEGFDKSGWQVVHDGIAEIQCEPLPDDSGYALSLVRTSGKKDSVTLRHINPDRGVHVPGKTYGAGLGVTKDGSYWIAQRETNATPPHADWRLAVRAGRDKR